MDSLLHLLHLMHLKALKLSESAWRTPGEVSSQLVKSSLVPATPTSASRAGCAGVGGWTRCLPSFTAAGLWGWVGTAGCRASAQCSTAAAPTSLAQKHKTCNSENIQGCLLYCLTSANAFLSGSQNGMKRDKDSKVQLVGACRAVFNYVKPLQQFDLLFLIFFSYPSVENKFDEVRDVAGVKIRRSESIPASLCYSAHHPCLDSRKEISWQEL